MNRYFVGVFTLDGSSRGLFKYEPNINSILFDDIITVYDAKLIDYKGYYTLEYDPKGTFSLKDENRKQLVTKRPFLIFVEKLLNIIFEAEDDDAAKLIFELGEYKT